MPGKKDAVADNYRIRNLPKNRLTWPDLVRRRVAVQPPLIAARTGYGPTFLVSAALAALASGLLIVRRRALAVPLTVVTR